MQVEAFDHVNLAFPADRTEDVVAFYSEKLGFEFESDEPEAAFDDGFARIRVGPGSTIHAWPDPDFERPSKHNWDHVALRVEARAATIKERLEAADIEIQSEGVRRGATGTFPSVYVDDPFGYSLEFKALGGPGSMTDDQ